MVALGDWEVLGRHLFKTHGPLTLGLSSETPESICAKKALALMPDSGDAGGFSCVPRRPGKSDVVGFTVP